MTNLKTDDGVDARLAFEPLVSGLTWREKRILELLYKHGMSAKAAAAALSRESEIEIKESRVYQVRDIAARKIAKVIFSR